MLCLSLWLHPHYERWEDRGMQQSEDFSLDELHAFSEALHATGDQVNGCKCRGVYKNEGRPAARSQGSYEQDPRGGAHDEGGDACCTTGKRGGHLSEAPLHCHQFLYVPEADERVHSLARSTARRAVLLTH
eukprot:XP_001707294.1 Hypothetical protein GL50803_20771 [Giardia lamblia ATCC 50803]